MTPSELPSLRTSDPAPPVVITTIVTRHPVIATTADQIIVPKTAIDLIVTCITVDPVVTVTPGYGFIPKYAGYLKLIANIEHNFIVCVPAFHFAHVGHDADRPSRVVHPIREKGVGGTEYVFVLILIGVSVHTGTEANTVFVRFWEQMGPDISQANTAYGFKVVTAWMSSGGQAPEGSVCLWAVQVLGVVDAYATVQVSDTDSKRVTFSQEGRGVQAAGDHYASENAVFHAKYLILGFRVPYDCLIARLQLDNALLEPWK
jgi:hypothetical protein